MQKRIGQKRKVFSYKRLFPKILFSLQLLVLKMHLHVDTQLVHHGFQASYDKLHADSKPKV